MIQSNMSLNVNKSEMWTCETEHENAEHTTREKTKFEYASFETKRKFNK